MNESDLFDKALDFTSIQARHYVVDALACEWHNTGYELSGNTEASDVEWFAQVLWREDEPMRAGQWENWPEESKRYYRDMARLSLKCLPRITERMAARLQAQSRALRTRERIARKQLEEVTE